MNQEAGEAIEQSPTDSIIAGQLTTADGGQAALYTAGEDLVNGDVVYVSSENTVVKADCTNSTKSKVIGIVYENASTGTDVIIVLGGFLTVTSASFTVNSPVFLSSSGRPTHTFPSSGSRVIKLGIPRSATKLTVDIQDLGKRA